MASARGISHPPSVVHHAYRRWLWTQGERWDEAGRGGAGQPAGWEPDGWLVGERFLHARRAPGKTCLDVGGHASPTAEAEAWRRRYPGS